MASETLRTLTITHRFAAAPERVFDAWIQPDKVALWMGAPAKRMTGTPDEIRHCKVDARVGGQFSFLVCRAGTEIDHAGEYMELDRPRRLVFTWGVPAYSPDFSTVSLDFAPDGDGTLVTLSASGVAAEYEDRVRQGWTFILEAIAEAA